MITGSGVATGAAGSRLTSTRGARARGGDAAGCGEAAFGAGLGASELAGREGAGVVVLFGAAGAGAVARGPGLSAENARLNSPRFGWGAGAGAETTGAGGATGSLFATRAGAR